MLDEKWLYVILFEAYVRFVSLVVEELVQNGALE